MIYNTNPSLGFTSIANAAAHSRSASPMAQNLQSARTSPSNATTERGTPVSRSDLTSQTYYFSAATSPSPMPLSPSPSSPRTLLEGWNLNVGSFGEIQCGYFEKNELTEGVCFDGTATFLLGSFKDEELEGCGMKLTTLGNVAKIEVGNFVRGLFEQRFLTCKVLLADVGENASNITIDHKSYTLPTNYQTYDAEDIQDQLKETIEQCLKVCMVQIKKVDDEDSKSAKILTTFAQTLKYFLTEFDI